MSDFDYDFTKPDYNYIDLANESSIEISDYEDLLGSEPLDSQLYSDTGIWSDGVSQDGKAETMSAFMTAKATIKSSVIEANAMLKSSAMEAQASIDAAIIDAEARCYEADKNYDAVEKQADTDLEIAMMEKEVEMEKIQVEREKLEVEKYRIDNVEKWQGMAAYESALAEGVEAAGEAEKDSAKAQSYLLEQPSWLNS